LQLYQKLSAVVIVSNKTVMIYKIDIQIYAIVIDVQPDNDDQHVLE